MASHGAIKDCLAANKAKGFEFDSIFAGLLHCQHPG
jgi:hypothetical protein